MFLVPAISPEVWRVTGSMEIPAVQDRAVAEMQTLMMEITKALVDDQDAVRVEVLPESGGVVLRLQVSAQDLGKVIGKQGRTARSLRTILSAASMKLKQRFSLDIVEIPQEGA